VAALAAPLLEAAMESQDAAVETLEKLVYELKLVCFCTGVTKVAGPRSVRVFEA